MKRKTIQENAADTILQRPVEIRVGSKTLPVAKPNLATIYAMRALLSKIKVERTENAFADAIRSTDNKDVVAELLAMLIIGERKRDDSLWGAYQYRKILRLRRETKDDILYNMEPKDIAHNVYVLLDTEQLTDFFVFTASLAEMSQSPQNGTAVKKTSGE